MAENEQQQLALPSVVDLDTIEDLREQLLDAVGQGPVLMDGSSVERIATNALIMLLAGSETARRCDCSYKISGASEAMTAAIARLGMQQQFAPVMEG